MGAGAKHGVRSESVEAAGLRCRELRPFSFIYKSFISVYLGNFLFSSPSFWLHVSLGCSVYALQLGKLTSWQGNKYCDATLCVCFLWRKKMSTTKREKKCLRNLMQSAFISSSTRLLPLSPCRLRRPERSSGWEEEEGQGWGEKKGEKKKKRQKSWWWWRRLYAAGITQTTHTHTHSQFSHTNSHCLHTEVL